MNTPLAKVAAAVETLCKVQVRGGKPSHRFAIVSVSKNRPTVETQIIAKKTGADLMDPAVLAAVVLASGGKLFSDGISVWDATAEAIRASKAKEYRESATAIRRTYRVGLTDVKEAAIDLG